MTTTTGAWRFPSDLAARHRFFAPSSFSHPAKLHLGLLQRLIDLYTAPGDTLLDPMAGSGSLLLAATQQRNVIIRDIEPSYVQLMHSSAPIIRQKAGLFAGLIDIDIADAKGLCCPHFDHIITSPPYGCRTQNGEGELSRKERLKDIQFDPRWLRRNTDGCAGHLGFRYANASGDNIGNKQGGKYWQDMLTVYSRLTELLPHSGKLILILKNHYRRGNLVDVVERTVDLIEGLGLTLTARHGRYIDNPSLWQRRRREAGLPIVDVEDVLVFEVAS